MELTEEDIQKIVTKVAELLSQSKDSNAARIEALEKRLAELKSRRTGLSKSEQSGTAIGRSIAARANRRGGRS